MRVLVLDVPAVESGALSILKQFHHEVCENAKPEDEWIFVISTPELEEKKNVKVVRYPWIKKSWFHRIFFDKFIVKKIIEEMDVDYVFSLQNTIVKGIDTPQVMYLHQPLPFVEKKYKFFENVKFWIYQNIISKVIIESAKNAEHIIVQTEWMKKSLNKLQIESSKISKCYPVIDLIDKVSCAQDYDCKKFLYPATPLEYKNHKVIIEACKRLDPNEYTIYFTLDGTENKISRRIFEEIKNNKLSIELIGRKRKEELFELYSNCSLIFPSYIETFGLPLLEARMSGSLVLASDTEFCKEVLNNYDNAYYFEAFSADELATLMKSVISKKIVKKDVEYKWENTESLYSLLLSLVDDIRH